MAGQLACATVAHIARLPTPSETRMTRPLRPGSVVRGSAAQTCAVGGPPTAGLPLDPAEACQRVLDPAVDLVALRAGLYAWFGRRRDALFERSDAALSAHAHPSLAHLSLAPLHRRGWGSVYAALRRGEIGEEALRALLARTASHGRLSPLCRRCSAHGSTRRRAGG